MHHQDGVHFENVTEVKFRDILLTGTGQTFKPGRMVGLSKDADFRLVFFKAQSSHLRLRLRARWSGPKDLTLPPLWRNP